MASAGDHAEVAAGRGFAPGVGKAVVGATKTVGKTVGKAVVGTAKSVAKPVIGTAMAVAKATSKSAQEIVDAFRTQGPRLAAKTQLRAFAKLVLEAPIEALNLLVKLAAEFPRGAMSLLAAVANLPNVGDHLVRILQAYPKGSINLLHRLLYLSEPGLRYALGRVLLSLEPLDSGVPLPPDERFQPIAVHIERRAGVTDEELESRGAPWCVCTNLDVELAPYDAVKSAQNKVNATRRLLDETMRGKTKDDARPWERHSLPKLRSDLAKWEKELRLAQTSRKSHAEAGTKAEDGELDDADMWPRGLLAIRPFAGVPDKELVMLTVEAKLTVELSLLDMLLRFELGCARNVSIVSASVDRFWMSAKVRIWWHPRAEMLQVALLPYPKPRIDIYQRLRIACFPIDNDSLEDLIVWVAVKFFAGKYWPVKLNDDAPSDDARRERKRERAATLIQSRRRGFLARVGLAKKPAKASDSPV